MRSNPHTPRGPTLSEVRALVGSSSMVLVLSMATHPSTRIHFPGLSGPLGLTSRPTLPTRRRRTVLTVHTHRRVTSRPQSSMGTRATQWDASQARTQAHAICGLPSSRAPWAPRQREKPAWPRPQRGEEEVHSRSTSPRPQAAVVARSSAANKHPCRRRGKPDGERRATRSASS